MEKNQIGIRFSFFAVLAFVFAIFGQLLLCGLVLGYAIVVEKKEWLIRQCMEALFLAFCMQVLMALRGLMSSIPGLFPFASFNLAEYWGAVGYVTGRTAAATPAPGILLGFAVMIINLLAVVFAIRSALRVRKGREANTPIVSQ